MAWYAPQICLAVLPLIAASEQSRPADSAMNKYRARRVRFKAITSVGKHVKISGGQIGAFVSQAHRKRNKHTGYL